MSVRLHLQYTTGYAYQPAADAAEPVGGKDNRVNEEVIIRLKWDQTEYKGRLVSIDSYMNVQLSGAEEWIDQKMTSVLGQVLIRCNNVLWIQAAKKSNGDVDTVMEG